jgi:hypothetical protein
LVSEISEVAPHLEAKVIEAAPEEWKEWAREIFAARRKAKAEVAPQVEVEPKPFKRRKLGAGRLWVAIASQDAAATKKISPGHNLRLPKLMGAQSQRQQLRQRLRQSPKQRADCQWCSLHQNSPLLGMTLSTR